MLAKSLKKIFFLFSYDEKADSTQLFKVMFSLSPIFSLSGMEKFTSIAGLIFLSQVFQFITAVKCNMQYFYNVNRTFRYAVK